MTNQEDTTCAQNDNLGSIDEQLVHQVADLIGDLPDLPRSCASEIRACDGLDWYAALEVFRRVRGSRRHAAVIRVLRDTVERLLPEEGPEGVDPVSAAALSTVDDLLNQTLDLGDDDVVCRIRGQIEWIDELDGAQCSAADVLGAAFTFALEKYQGSAHEDYSICEANLGRAVRRIVLWQYNAAVRDRVSIVEHRAALAEVRPFVARLIADVDARCRVGRRRAA